MEHQCRTSLIFFCFSTRHPAQEPKEWQHHTKKTGWLRNVAAEEGACAAVKQHDYHQCLCHEKNIVEFLVFKAPCGELSGFGIADLLWKLKQTDSWRSILAFSSFQNHLKTSHLRNMKYQIINHHYFWDFLLKRRGFLSLWITPGDAGLRLIQTAGWHPYRSASPPRWCQWLRTWASLWNSGNICTINKEGKFTDKKFWGFTQQEWEWNKMITSSSSSKKYSPQDPTMLHRATWRIGRCWAPEIK